jgi:protein-disulfide isomerase
VNRSPARREPRSVRRLTLLSALLAALAVLAGPAAAERSGSPPTGVAKVERLFAGLPQHGTTLGHPSAKVTLYEFGDLRCPVCRNYELNYLPQFLDRWVRTGKVKIAFELWPILGPDSVVAARAGVAAQHQNRFWQFAELSTRTSAPRTPAT